MLGAHHHHFAPLRDQVNGTCAALSRVIVVCPALPRSRFGLIYLCATIFRATVIRWRSHATPPRDSPSSRTILLLACWQESGIGTFRNAGGLWSGITVCLCRARLWKRQLRENVEIAPKNISYAPFLSAGPCEVAGSSPSHVLAPITVRHAYPAQGKFGLFYFGTPLGWKLTPSWAWSMYIERFYTPIARARPNKGHEAIARLEKESGKDVAVITMNVDGLHQVPVC